MQNNNNLMMKTSRFQFDANVTRNASSLFRAIYVSFSIFDVMFALAGVCNFPFWQSLVIMLKCMRRGAVPSLANLAHSDVIIPSRPGQAGANR